MNTASPLLLQSLTYDVTVEDMESIIALRTDRPYQDVEAFVEEQTFAGKEISENHLTVSSQYFLLTANVMLGDVPLTLQSVLYRTENGSITVIQRRLGPTREGLLSQTDNTGYKN